MEKQKAFDRLYREPQESEDNGMMAMSEDSELAQQQDNDQAENEDSLSKEYIRVMDNLTGKLEPKVDKVNILSEIKSFDITLKRSENVNKLYSSVNN